MTVDPNHQLFVGIDCGSQSAKVTVFDASGTVVASGHHMLAPMHRPRPGVVLHPDDDLGTAIASACKIAVTQLGSRVAQIAGIGLCPIRCCKAFLRSDGSLVEPVMSWMDDRAYQPYLPESPDLAYATTASGYLTHKLTGSFTDTAANNISMQWPLDASTWKWSTDPVVQSNFCVPSAMLFDLCMPGDIAGYLTHEAAAATGLPAGTPVVATANDKAVELLGAGPLDSSTVLVSLGTYIAAMMPGRKFIAAPTSFWTNLAAMPGQYLYESNGVRRGMWTLTWMLDLLGPEFASAAHAEGISRESYIEREATRVPAGSDGLLTVLDWLATPDAPFRKGSFLGFDARHTRAHMYRSILEAIAITMKHHVDAMTYELGGALNGLVLSGGGANSTLFSQIFADVFGITVWRSTGPSGAALGAAMCAAAATGTYPDIPAACTAMGSPRESFVANTSRHATYADVSAVYADVRLATDAVYQRTFPLFH